MDELFASAESLSDSVSVPLAERMRPKALTDIIGQEHLLAADGAITRMVKSGNIQSIIFWGPPGVGKTTLAYAIASESDYRFLRISAVEAGVKELREIINSAQANRSRGIRTILFIDEIHRFNKSQQDALLHAVERGILVLIGATTENPSFEVNSALLSRCRVYKLSPLQDTHLKELITKAITEDAAFSKFNITIADWEAILIPSGSDARTALNILESAVAFVATESETDVVIDRSVIEKVIQSKVPLYDKSGESHYDTISAFIKSMRGSDPDAALFWMAKMLESGEDPKFIARRMVVFASEDIGNADPMALSVAVSVFQAVTFIGMPECSINLAQGVTYLASAPKSNASYLAINQVMGDIRNGIDTTVPMKLRNAPTKFMKSEGYGKDYKYPHDFEGHFVEEKYFPDSLKPKIYYNATEIGKEAEIALRLKSLWKHRNNK
ncbi:MAG: replication-associated recombination protein A [Candidatus Kapabacteria bacterium]|nr:replication-associated recombination protein A [Candidatus Kapabacteria bacterium]